jgi:5-methyltetrahydrofolate--homocysteine methyltransferase
LLTTTMPFMQMSIKEIEEAGLNIPVIVGGAPVTEDFANSINATGYGDNAPIAVDICKKLIGVSA